ncbi:dopamine beta hydroxylase-like protein precursor [Aplysia californica]|uniref:Dopamine beta hydroxylase-like protein n=1 Tax=Aplysia californica TaxID=6500 RepID=A1L026_APLCA|nr:dopamine beta hydroxylase-like protein precursor [Aplysia californica]AAY42041.1 dopamine beta hydroxylase-like protein [Aplysia californica]
MTSNKTTRRLLLSLFPLLVLVKPSSAYQRFLELIPNGGRVPSPCDGQPVWQGVGHITKDGGSQRNQFGIDFLSQGQTWTTELCEMDSDGDGRSNGEELGDPNCTWRQGAGPTQSDAVISHPGICEPVTSECCQRINSFLDCDGTRKLKCGHIQEDKTVKKELKLVRSPVPASETTYFCQVFDLDLDRDMHMVATEPMIDASQVVHHILMFGCDPRDTLDSRLKSPYPCEMVPHPSCRSLIGAWTLGSVGECAHPEAGFRMGPRGYRSVAIQVHWNNPKRLSGLQDSSGLLLHLTSQLRPNDAGMLVIGQRFMQIEPRSEYRQEPPASGVWGRKESAVDQGDADMSFSASCPGRCTKVMFTTPIYITAAVNHMHYPGKAQSIELYRNNTLIQKVTDQSGYDYDDPVFYNFASAIRVEPGDELRTTCVYKRTATPEPVCWGEATSDEMCFGFLTYFPLQSLSHPWCTSVKSLPSCDRHLPSLGRKPITGCRWWEFRNASQPETQQLMRQVFAKCYAGGKEALKCTDDCRKAAGLVAKHPCMQGDIGTYMVDRFKKGGGDTAKLFLDAVVSCSCRHFDYCDRKYKNGILGAEQEQFCPVPDSASSMRQSTVISLCAILSYLCHIWL